MTRLGDPVTIRPGYRDAGEGPNMKGNGMRHRIEKSGFHAGGYVGYCDGPWRIVKRPDGRDVLSASTLDNLGKALDQRANIAVGKMLFR